MMFLVRRNWWVWLLTAVFFSTALPVTGVSSADWTVAQAKKKAKKKARPAKRRAKAKTKSKAKSAPTTAQPQATETKGKSESTQEKLSTGPAKIQLPMIEEQKAAAAPLEEKLLDEEIAQLRDIIQTTAEGPVKADLLFRLAERYYKKARKIYEREMQQYDEKVAQWVVEQEKNPNAPEPKIDNRQSQVYTKQAVEVYKIILNRYKEYPRRDEVMFTIGYNLYETGEKPEGVKMYWQLIKEYPESRFVPDAYLAMGEHYFNSNDVFNAKKAYERALKYTDSKVYTFALYKLAWCDYNLGEYDGSLNKFKEVVGLADKEAQQGAQGDKNKIQLKREALQDMILAFSQVDALEQAEEYYLQQVGKNGTLEFMRKLAAAYEKQGKSEMVIKSNRRLLDEYPSDPDCPAYHNSIVLAYRKLNDRGKVKQEVNRLIDQYKPGSQWAESNRENKMALAKANSLVEESLRDLVTNYHKEAQETNSWDTYNLSRTIYAKYLETFPNSEYAYKLRWYYADILYKMGDFYGSAAQYAKVVETNAKGPFSAEAAYNAVLSWDKCIELRDTKATDCRKWQPQTGKGKLGKEESRTIKKQDLTFVTKGKVSKDQLQKEEIPFFDQKFLEAADVFSKVAPSHDMYIPIRFKSAYIFYKHHDFQEMARRFGEIIERYPKHELALQAVRLSLNTLYVKATSEDISDDDRTGHWKEINHWALAFKNNKVLMDSPAAKKEKFDDEVQSLIEESGYNIILAQRQKDPLQAASGFEQFVNDFPKSKYSHRALFAAMVVFNEANQLDLAIGAGTRLLKDYPESDRITPTIGFLADFENRVANFHQAAYYNELYFKKWLEQKEKGSPNKRTPEVKRSKGARHETKDSAKEGAGKSEITEKEAMDALYNAALLRESMGQFGKAIKNYTEYIKFFPEAKDTPDIFYRIGLIYERRSNWRNVDRVFQAYPEKYASLSTPGRLLAVSYKQAMALRQLQKEKDSDKLLDKIIESYGKLPEEARDEASRTAVSHARFLQLEKEFNEYINIKLVLPPKTLEKNLFRKIDQRPKLEKKYEEIVGFQDPDWSIAALVRIGQLSQNLSQSMYDAPIPAGLTPDQQDIYVQELQKQALPLEEKATALYQKAIDVSNAKGIYNEWTIQAQELLKVYQPSAYPEPFTADLVSTEYFYQAGLHADKVKLSPQPQTNPMEPKNSEEAKVKP